MVIEEANRRGLGGVRDWDPLTSQAAAWIAIKSALENKPISETARHFGDYFRKYYAQSTWDGLPAAETGHLPLLRYQPEKVRREHTDLVASVVRDKSVATSSSSAMARCPARRSRAPGVFGDKVGYGYHSQVALGECGWAGSISSIRPALTC